MVHGVPTAAYPAVGRGPVILLGATATNLAAGWGHAIRPAATATNTPIIIGRAVGCGPAIHYHALESFPSQSGPVQPFMVY